jgi:hypothetical protein
MTLKHTPGPWTADDSGLITAGPRRLHIAQTATTGMGHAAAANALLLAAAPELYAALIDAIDALEVTAPGAWAIKQAREAINKATAGA